MPIREIELRDRPAVHDLLRASGVFTEEEVSTALEVLDVGIAGGLDGDYPAFVVEDEGRVCGYVCVGKTPLTAGTWHLYWICVHPESQRTGLGRALQSHIEQFIRSRGGERIVLETSGQTSYELTRRFYRSAGYREVGRIKDFYKAGDDCVIFCKEFK